MQELDNTTVESSELVEQTFKFWFTDNEHIRSPFPSYIHDELKAMATGQFFNWASTLDPNAKEELTDELVGEKFEEFIFESALTLIKTDDEKITILYPFLPRLGDNLNDDNGEESEVIKRALTKDGDHNFLKVTCQKQSDSSEWQTEFQLPV